MKGQLTIVGNQGRHKKQMHELNTKIRKYIDCIKGQLTGVSVKRLRQPVFRKKLVRLIKKH